MHQFHLALFSSEAAHTIHTLVSTYIIHTLIPYLSPEGHRAGTRPYRLTANPPPPPSPVPNPSPGPKSSVQVQVHFTHSIVNASHLGTHSLLSYSIKHSLFKPILSFISLQPFSLLCPPPHFAHKTASHSIMPFGFLCVFQPDTSFSPCCNPRLLLLIANYLAV